MSYPSYPEYTRGHQLADLAMGAQTTQTTQAAGECNEAARSVRSQTHFEVLNTARGVTPEVEKRVADVMTYLPWDEQQKLAGAMVVAALSSAIRTIIEHVPPSPHRQLAIQKVIEARLLANSAITHRGNL